MDTPKSEIFDVDKSFKDLGLSEPLLDALMREGFNHPTVIQSQLIPVALTGRDVLGQAKTGTGKTAAFGLPMLERTDVERRVLQGLVLVPTRELAIQAADELGTLGEMAQVLVTPIFGGGSMSKQIEKLKKGRHLVVGTPGRVLDMHRRGHLRYEHISTVVLDEVDRMLDIGFRDDMRRILGELPADRQTVFVSATISPEIEQLARSFMRDPEKIVVAAGSLTVSQVDQTYLAVEPWDKRRLLKHLLTHEEPGLSIVFCRTKRSVNDVTKYLNDKGIDAHAIHGDMYQGKRNRIISRLKKGNLSVLVASDLAARGLDASGITHVINYDLPDDPEVYVHRIGRTARTGRTGIAWSFVTPDQGGLLTTIEMLINREIPRKEYPDFEPGPVPAKVRAEKELERERSEQAKERGARFGPQSLAAGAATDKTKFPGGVVPTGQPRRVMGGRARTRRGR